MAWALVSCVFMSSSSSYSMIESSMIEHLLLLSVEGFLWRCCASEWSVLCYIFPLFLELSRDEYEGLLCMYVYVMADSWLVSFGSQL